MTPNNFGRLWEFFEDDSTRLSMSRLTVFGAFWVASYIVILNAKSATIGDLLSWYLSAFVLGYLGGKGFDMMSSRGPNPAANVQINQPEKVNIPGDAT
jgi:hypothetical protein